MTKTGIGALTIILATILFSLIACKEKKPASQPAVKTVVGKPYTVNCLIGNGMESWTVYMDPEDVRNRNSTRLYGIDAGTGKEVVFQSNCWAEAQ